MSWLTESLGILSVAVNIHGAMKFADDNRPRVTYQKHISYQKRLQRVGKMRRIPNKLLNYNVKFDYLEVKANVENNEQGHRYLIVEPQGWENGKQKYYARMACDKNFKNCTSLTTDFNK